MKTNTIKNKRVKFAVAAIAASLILMIGATLAIFTDYKLGSATGTAGTVEIDIDDANFSLLDPDGKDIFNPGDGRLVNAKVSNIGNKSVDLRQTLTVTMEAKNAAEFTALPDDATTPMGWVLYAKSDCTEDANGNWVPNSGAEPIAPDSFTDNGDGTATAVYVLDEIVLNGTGTVAEIEPGVSITYTSGDYVLVMLLESDNSYQGAIVSLDLLAEAKQHRNTSDIDDWTDYQTATTKIGGADVPVVPATNQDVNGEDLV